MSMKNAVTLKGVFPEPKMQHKRDFLKENKIKLREFQKLRLINQASIDEEQQLRNLRERRVRRIHSGCSCMSEKTSVTSISTKTGSVEKLGVDKGIQTDDIADEQFLSNALQRCASITSNGRHNRIHNSRDHLSVLNHENALKLPHCDLSPIENDQIFADLKLELNHAQSEDNLDLRTAPNSGKMSSKSHSKSIQSLDTVTGRRVIKIPKYLEREKRERELQRLKALERDPNCPEGHYPMNEDDRKFALADAEKQFRALVDELNRLPMTSQTLKTRNRKMEIEKALVDLEMNIRLFSKPKVYLKIQ